MPKLRWPGLSPRARALLMIGLMCSPAFLADSIGYCVERLFMTADQIAAKQVPDTTVLKQVHIFRVACASSDMQAADRARWIAFATQHGWPRYPQAGSGCFTPGRWLYGIGGVKAFSVACPNAILTVADRQQWIAFAANHGWTAYPQAGDGCVDP